MSQILQAAVSSLFGTLYAARRKFAEDWGEVIDWVPIDIGMKRARREGKMVMAIVQKDECRNCEKLKSVFRKNKEIQKLSKYFIMTNVSDNEVQKKQEFHPDGLYTPRILFFDSSGKLMPGVKRDASLRVFRYFYSTEIQLLTTMKKVLKEPSRYVKTDRYP